MKALALALVLGAVPSEATAAAPATMAEVLEQSKPTDWRPLDPQNTIYLELPTGRVVIELAEKFAPKHVANIKALVSSGYFDGLSILRSQDNYVVQWGDPNAENGDKAKPLAPAATKLPAEFTRSSRDLDFTKLKGPDLYAPEVGWSSGFPAGRDPKSKEAWLSHCYGSVGAGRGTPPDSSNGAELYVVIGHSPRHLDRNITLVGRVLRGMELLSVLPRGKGALGFYEKPEERMTIQSVKLASALPETEREALEVFRTDTAAFERLVESRKNRREPWFANPVGKIELCNVPIPVRPIAKKPTQ